MMLPRIPVMGWRAVPPREARASSMVSQTGQARKDDGILTPTAKDLSNKVSNSVKERSDELKNASGATETAGRDTTAGSGSTAGAGNTAQEAAQATGDTTDSAESTEPAEGIVQVTKLTGERWNDGGRIRTGIVQRTVCQRS